MIISHKHKYIFVKPGKVAGTSTEIFFEQISFSDEVLGDFHEKKSGRDEIIHSEGIVGLRATDSKDSGATWYNHMKLPEIKKLLNNDKLFNEYFVLCCCFERVKFDIG